MAGLGYTFSNDNFRMRWKEPYVTEGLNKKMYGVLSKGVYRGFRMAAASGNAFGMAADPETGDSVAVVETASGHSLTVRVVGDITGTYGGYYGTNIVPCLVVSYGVGVDTEAFVQVYSATEYDALSDAAKELLIPLGTYYAVSSSSNFSDAKRREAWENTPSGMSMPVQLVRNNSGRLGPLAVDSTRDGPGSLRIPYWKCYFTSSPPASQHVFWRLDTAAVRTGRSALTIYHDGSNVSYEYVHLQQELKSTSTEVSQYRVSFYARRLQNVNLSGSYVRMYLEFVDAAGAVVGTLPSSGSELLVDLDAGGGVDPDFVYYEASVEPPAGAVLLNRVYFYMIVRDNSGSPFTVCAIDDVRVSAVMPAEKVRDLDIGDIDTYQPVNAQALFLSEAGINDAGGEGALLHYDEAGNYVGLERKDGADPNAGNYRPKLKLDQIDLQHVFTNQDDYSALADLLFRTAGGFDGHGLLAEILGGYNFDKLRLYCSSQLWGVLCWNTVWNPSTERFYFEDDSAGEYAWGIQFGKNSLRIVHADVDSGPPAPWSYLGWPQEALEIQRSTGTSGASSTYRIESENIYIDHEEMSLVDYITSALSFGTVAPASPILKHYGSAGIRFFLCNYTSPDYIYCAFTKNAYWDEASSLWKKYDTGEETYAYTLGNDGFHLYYIKNGHGNSGWTDWTSVEGTALGEGSGQMFNHKWLGSLSGPGSILEDMNWQIKNTKTGAYGSNPAYNNGSYYKNQIVASNQIKAWAYLETNGASGFTMRDGWGWSTISISGTDLLFTLQDAFAAADDYGIIFSGWTIAGSPVNDIRVLSKATTGFELDSSGTSFAGTACGVTVLIVGKYAS